MGVLRVYVSPLPARERVRLLVEVYRRTRAEAARRFTHPLTPSTRGRTNPSSRFLSTPGGGEIGARPVLWFVTERFFGVGDIEDLPGVVGRGVKDVVAVRFGSVDAQVDDLRGVAVAEPERERAGGKSWQRETRSGGRWV